MPFIGDITFYGMLMCAALNINVNVEQVPLFALFARDFAYAALAPDDDVGFGRSVPES